MTPASRSTWTMLLWHEWRQQRLPFLAIAGLCTAAYFGYNRFSRGNPDIRGGFILLVLAATCLGANAFASEQDDGTDAFLSGLPLPVWRRMLTKYGLVVLLALLSMAVPLCMGFAGDGLGPSYQSWDGCRLESLFSWEVPKNPTGLAGYVLLMVTAAVSLTCVLARRGFNSLAVLLLAMAAWPVYGFVFAWGEDSFADVAYLHGLNWYSRLLVVIWVTWGVLQIAAVSTWFRRQRPAGRSWWGPVLWVAIVLGTPAIAFPALAELHYVHYAFGGPTELPDLPLDVRPVSDSTIAIAITIPSRPSALKRGYRMWLMDVDTGRIRRVRRHWPHSRILNWFRRLGRGKPPDIAARREALAKARARRGWRQPSKGAQFGRLIDGTFALRLKDGWQFSNPITGKFRTCKHPRLPAEPDPVADQDSQTLWSERAVLVLQTRYRDNDEAVCSISRYAPELARAECSEIVLGRGKDSLLSPVAMNHDATKLLLAKWTRPHRVLRLVSLDDMSSEDLPLPDAPGSCQQAFFTPDGELLLLATTPGLSIWNVSGHAWEEGIAIPGVRPDSMTWFRHYNDEPPGKISANPPWRVAALVGGSNPGAFVLDVENRKAIQLQLPEQDRSTSSPVAIDQLRWLGEHRLLMECFQPYRLWVIDDDGTDCRRLIP